MPVAEEPPELPGAAGQFLHILVERQRREFETLNGGQIGKDRLAQIVNGHPGLDRNGGRLNAVRALRREYVGTEQLFRVRVGHQLDQSREIDIQPRVREQPGSEAEVEQPIADFRFNPNTGRQAARARVPVCADFVDLVGWRHVSGVRSC